MITNLEVIIQAIILLIVIYIIKKYFKTEENVEYISHDKALDIFNKFKSYGWYYKPTFYLNNKHLQTCFGAFNVAEVKQVIYKQEILELKDNEKIALHWFPELPEAEFNGDILLLLHGMGGGSHASYIKDLIDKCFNGKLNNVKVVVFNYRGCGELPLTLPRVYDAGDTEDLTQVLNHIKSRNPNSKIYGVGFSIGGNILSKYLGEQGSESLVDGAVCLANPFDMVTCSRNMLRKNINYYFYTPLFVNILKRPLLRNSKLFSDLLNKKWKTVRDFEYDITIKNKVLKNKYHCIDQYYRLSSSAPFVHNIKKPCLFINAKDDPISIDLAIPKEEIMLNPNCLLMLTSKGGHLGWWQNDKLSLKSNSYWSTPLIATFLIHLINAY